MMHLKFENSKLLLGILYLIIISIGLYILLSFVEFSDLTNYSFIKENREIILTYRENKLLLLILSFFIFCIIWVLLLGFASPLLIFSGFVFGKWWGTLIVLASCTIGATILYMLAKFFFRDIINKYLVHRFNNLRSFFQKNEFTYFLFFRFVGGTPFPIQNILPVLFDMSVKNYFLATFIGLIPSMFIAASFGSGLENYIGENVEMNITSFILSPEIYIPIAGFFGILVIAFVFKKYFFKLEK